MRKVITVDGLAGTGKTTLSRLLAEKLGYIHLSSGLLYRALAYIAIQNDVSSDDSQRLKILLDSHKIALTVGDKGQSQIEIDGILKGEELHSLEVSKKTSEIAALSVVRDGLILAQREAFLGHGIVAEGRDMGTVIFPNATLKFFVEVDIPVRVQRRMAQIIASQKGDFDPNTLKIKVEKEVTERDKRDSERDIAPTVAAKDAIIINNSSKTLTEVVQTMYDVASQRGFCQ